ncbi:MAG: nucleotide exchange factor GrpE [Actinomycetota bacterium]|nr:nucleotide exchange factor GrpE [Actinomycetota bacterium]
MTEKNEKAGKDYEKAGKNSGNGEDKEKLAGLKESGGKTGKSRHEKGVRNELEVEELEEEVELLRKELDGYKKVEEEYVNRIKRLQADYDNYRKRTLREHLEHIKRANKNLIEKLLPVIDNFEAAIETGSKLAKGKDDFFKGVNMIYESLIDILKKENVKVVDPAGEEFNPETCEVAVTEDVKDIKEGHIIEVMRKGYLIDDFLIRPAVVKVCKKK